MSRHEDQNIAPSGWMQDWDQQAASEVRDEQRVRMLLSEHAYSVETDGEEVYVLTSFNGVDVRRTFVSMLDREAPEFHLKELAAMLADVRSRTLLDMATYAFREAQASEANQ